MNELCVDARMIQSSGIGTYLRNIIWNIKDGPFKISLIADPSSLNKLGWETSFEVIPCKAPIYSLKEQIEIPRIAPKCDIFWSPHYNVPLFPIRARKRLVTIHDLYHLAYFSSLGLFEKIYAKTVLNYAVNFSHRIVTVSHFSFHEILKYTKADSKKISVIHSGVESEFFSSLQSNDSMLQTKEKFQLPEKYILYVGNVKPHKNLIGVLKAFRILLNKGYEDYNLLIVGKNEGFRNGVDLKSCIQADPVLAKKVFLLGCVEDQDLPSLYQLATIFILPSLYEGFGLPPLEAMSAGCPVVVSKAASLPEICKDACVYIDPLDVEDMAQGIECLLKDPDKRRELRQKGIARSKEFCWKKAAQNHIKLFEEMCRT